jgi:hypothetical protein
MQESNIHKAGETQDDSNRFKNLSVLGSLHAALSHLRVNKPGDRSELDRVYAVAITDLEKVVAYFQVYAVGDE